MHFPPQPETDVECRAELLRLMSVSRFPGIYVLGCFSKYVTVYAQQVRALNLIDSLAKTGVLSRQSRVALIGGGIAGLTAAAGAAVRGVQSVSVFEKLHDTMRLQRGSEKRFIHPYIYDWPENSEKGDTADLPIMRWKADIAANVVEQLDAQWNEVQAKVGNRLPPPHYDCDVTEISADTEGPQIKIKGKDPQNFDVVILTVGFGRDEHAATAGYWTDTGLDGLEVESGGTWFVSGYGDGALTDLMRLCIMDFRHGNVITAVNKATRDEVGEQLMAAERSDKSPAELAEVYKEAARKIANRLDQKLKRRQPGRIVLNCSERELFSPKSSVLNRLIAAYLLNGERFELISKGKIIDLKKDLKGYVINFESNPAESMNVDNVIIRHGPDRALEKSFPDIWKAFRSIDAEWKSARQHDDWTRKPMYQKDEFDLDRRTIPPLRVDFGEKVGCVVITGGHKLKGLNQTQIVEQALDLLAKRTGSTAIAGLSIDTKPESIEMNYALSSSASYERTVRALCESDIAVFDVTGLESAIMLFLGIRAAARRGITITLTEDNLARKPLPFNLLSLNPLHTEDGAEHITEAIDAGLAALKAQPNAYLDLPVFDSVRHLGEDYRPIGPEAQILILRWFDEQYNTLVRSIVNPRLRGKFGKQTSIVTTLDSQSPQLVEQRLYAAIRRTKLCLADWTGWRPNVLFETGVRLAVNSSDPILTLCTDPPPGWNDAESTWPDRHDSSTRALQDFFRPTEFTFGNYKGLHDVIDDLEEDKLGARGAKIPPGRTYKVVSESIKRREEPGGRAVSDLLMFEVRTMAGPAVPEEGGLPVLFREVLTDQVWQASVEYSLAAWFYLDGRYDLVRRFSRGDLSATDPNLIKLQQIGQDLKDRLRNAPRGKFEEIKKKLLEDWETIKPAREITDG